MMTILTFFMLMACTMAAELASAPRNLHYIPSNIAQSVSLTAPLTRFSTVYTLKPIRDADSTSSAHWIVGLAGRDQGFLEAVVGKTSANKKAVTMTKLGTGQDHLTYYSIDLSAASPGPITLSLIQVQSHLTVAKPRSLPQTAETAFLSFTQDLLSSVESLSSNEKSQVAEIKIKIKVPTPRINGEIAVPDGFTSEYTKGSTTIVFTSKAGLNLNEVRDQTATIEYQQPSAVVSIRKLDRLIEVSHWGSNIAVEDSIDLFNSGPLLKGQFSRLYHQKNLRSQRGQALSINDFTLQLPTHASSPYYVDIVGNVSTSRFRPAPSSGRLPSPGSSSIPSQLQLTPRYPLMGGWNYTFTIGYNTPLSDSVRSKKIAGERRFSLKMPFMTTVSNVAVDDARVRVRLPEGAFNIQLSTPFDLDSSSVPANDSPASFFSQSGEGVEKTYLDSTGRPTVVLSKRNCGDRHGGDFAIEYSLPLSRDLLQKPFAIASILSILFLSTSLVKKIAWTI